jgi:hypothetical protein
MVLIKWLRTLKILVCLILLHWSPIASEWHASEDQHVFKMYGMWLSILTYLQVTLSDICMMSLKKLLERTRLPAHLSFTWQMPI